MTATLAIVPEDDGLWTVDDVAKLLRASKSWIYKQATAGKLPCIRIGAMLRFEPPAIRAWLASHREGGGPKEALTVGPVQSVTSTSAKED